MKKTLLLSLFTLFGTSLFAQQKYSNVKITGYDLVKYPTHRPNDDTWDWDIYPDVMLTLINSSTRDVIFQSPVLKNCRSPKNDIQFDKVYKLENLDLPVLVSIYDYDDNKQHEPMAYFGNLTFSQMEGYPTRFRLSDGGAEIVLHLSWY